MIQADVLIILDSCRSGLAVGPSNLRACAPAQGGEEENSKKSKYGKELISVGWGDTAYTGEMSIANALSETLLQLAKSRLSFSTDTLTSEINKRLSPYLDASSQNEQPPQVSRHRLQRHSQNTAITLPVL
ncbi:hypothetical protein TWF730_009763 [Orbilia blumenaviensis]|uniref:Uncharacterized protein n=1 Tax=Orbilia blumenaviensis TaxID=1796055 RepID=A0AAV9UU58_9PEZI